jgi:20S proteasome subunit beta 1
MMKYSFELRAPEKSADLQVPYALSGSGSTYITGYVDKNWKTGMTADEGRDFCLRAIAHAFNRDGSSGGCVRLVTISKDGYCEEFVPHNETPQGYGELPFAAAALPMASVTR